MHFRVTFSVLKLGQLLPLSYQYELSAWIYKQIERTDSEFASFLHEEGYYNEGKRFKLFTFSNLFIPPPYEIIGDRIKIGATEISFTLSFLVNKAATNLIIALFKQRTFRLGDKITQIELKVKEVNSIDILLNDSATYRLRTTSPMMVSAPKMDKNNKLRHQYLSPIDTDFEHYFFQNLIRKYKTALAHQLIEEINIDQPMKLKLTSDRVKKQGVRISAYTPRETKIIGYQFNFEIQAPKELVRIGLMAGFGGDNAIGFGATRLLNY